MLKKLDCPIHELYVSSEISHLPCLICLCNEKLYYAKLKKTINNILHDPKGLWDNPFHYNDYKSDLALLRNFTDSLEHDLKYFENYISYLADNSINLRTLIYFEHMNKFQVKTLARKPNNFVLQLCGSLFYQPLSPDHYLTNNHSNPVKIAKCLKSEKELSFYYTDPLVEDSLLFLPKKLKTLQVIDSNQFKLYGLHKKVMAEENLIASIPPSTVKQGLKKSILNYMNNYKNLKNKHAV